MIRGFCSDLPASGIARDFVSLAGMHSAPNMPSTGLALMIGSREADPMSVQPAVRLMAGSPGWMPRGGATLSPRRRRAPFTLGYFLPAEVLGGRVVERVGSDATVLFISLVRELGGETAQNFAQRLPCIGVAHVLEHEGSHAREAVKACQELGNVCRA